MDEPGLATMCASLERLAENPSMMPATNTCIFIIAIICFIAAVITWLRLDRRW